MELDRRIVLLGAGVATAAVIIMFRKKLASAAGVVIDDAKRWAFEAVISDAAAQYSDVILRVAGEKGIDPFIIVALGEQETHWGAMRGKNGTTGPSIIGFDGTGHGIMQIDSGTWASWLNVNNWADPYTNVSKGAQILKDNLRYFAGKGITGGDQVTLALAAYNHGPGRVWSNYQSGGLAAIDRDSRGNDNGYSRTVAASLASLSNAFVSTLGSV